MSKITRGAKPMQSEADWSLDDAKAKFSEIARRAKTTPQFVAVSRGRRVAIVEAEVLERLMSRDVASPPLVDFLEGLHVPGLDLEREDDPGRDVAL